jgi:hypothetical protein
VSRLCARGKTRGSSWLVGIGKLFNIVGVVVERTLGGRVVVLSKSGVDDGEGFNPEIAESFFHTQSFPHL